MLHFLQQHLAFAQQAVLFQQEHHIGLSHVAGVGHVLDGQQDPGVRLVGMDEALDTHHQPPVLDARPDQVGLATARQGLVQECVPQQQPQRRHVPFAPAEIGKRKPVGLGLVDIERRAERRGGAHHPQIAIEKQQRDL